MKVLIRGGSIAAGKGVKESYADLLQKELSKKGIDLVNVSREKDTSFEGIWNFYEDIFSFKPDLLILHFGIDDIYRPVYRSELKENLVQIVRLAREKFNPRIFLMTSHILNNHYDMEAVHSVYRTIKEVSCDLECIMVPVHLYWMNHIYEHNLHLEEFIQSDCRYPNEKGHHLYAESIMKALSPYLDEEPAK